MTRPVLRQLTGIRALAALWVVLFHFSTLYGILVPAVRLLSPLNSEGFYGVDLFFILSGFILTYNYASRNCTYREFVGNRFARIYPVHLLTLLVLAGLLLATRLSHASVTDGHYGAREFALNLALIQSWGLTDGRSWNYPSWSLSAEWFAYLLVFPAASVLLRNVRQIRVVALIIGALLIGYSVVCPKHEFGGYSPLIQVTLEFLAGCFLFRLSELWNMPRLLADWMVNTSAVCLFLIAWMSSPDRINPLLILLFAVLILGLSRSSGVVSGVLGSRVAVYLGEISYALYMSHGILQKIFTAALPLEHFQSSPLIVRCLIIVFSLVAMLLVASAIYHGIEVPARVWLRRMAASRNRMAAVAVGRS